MDLECRQPSGNSSLKELNERILRCRLAVLGPLVLATDLILLLGREIVLDVERLADLLRGLALDHICNSLASDIEERLDIKVVGSLDRLLADIRRMWGMKGSGNVLG